MRSGALPSHRQNLNLTWRKRKLERNVSTGFLALDSILHVVVYLEIFLEKKKLVMSFFFVKIRNILERFLKQLIILRLKMEILKKNKLKITMLMKFYTHPNLK